MNFPTSEGYFFRKIPAIKASFAPKQVLTSRVSEIWEKCKDVPTKILKRDARANSS